MRYSCHIVLMPCRALVQCRHWIDIVTVHVIPPMFRPPETRITITLG